MGCFGTFGLGHEQRDDSGGVCLSVEAGCVAVVAIKAAYVISVAYLVEIGSSVGNLATAEWTTGTETFASRVTVGCVRCVFRDRRGEFGFGRLRRGGQVIMGSLATVK